MLSAPRGGTRQGEVKQLRLGLVYTCVHTIEKKYRRKIIL